MVDFLIEKETVWQRLKNETRPIVMYGMGDGAVKILNIFEQCGITVADIFASDEFVRGHSFAGYKVLKFSEIKEKYKDFIIVISFASQRPEVLELLYNLDDNYDVVAPDVPVIGSGIFDMEFLQKHKSAILEVYDMLADDVSKRTFAATINFKISGKLKYLREFTTDKMEAFETILKPHREECFVDLGAYNGDTIRELLGYTDTQYKSIVAFEPDKRNYKKLSKYAEENQLNNVELYNVGAWNKRDVLLFEGKAGRNSALGAKKGIETIVNSVDEILNGRPATMIKFDVEGSEKEAIEGAKNTIQTYKPRINMAVYHRNEDIFAIPLQLKELCPQYKLYLRHHPYIPSWDTNLYATI